MLFDGLSIYTGRTRGSWSLLMEEREMFLGRGEENHSVLSQIKLH